MSCCKYVMTLFQRIIKMKNYIFSIQISGANGKHLSSFSRRYWELSPFFLEIFIWCRKSHCMKVKNSRSFPSSGIFPDFLNFNQLSVDFQLRQSRKIILIFSKKRIVKCLDDKKWNSWNHTQIVLVNFSFFKDFASCTYK